MEEKSSSSVNNNDGVKFGIEEAWKWVPSGTHWWWVIASAAQLGWGIKSYKKGFTGDCRFMPARAFGVASLFVGAAATASVSALSAAGIHNGKHLVYVRTLKGDQKDEPGSTRYFIDLQASDDLKINTYYAQVLEIAGLTPTKKKLEVFKRQENAPIAVAN
uniref:Uncharacterized protein n=1 Tax=Chenopodium quinoa TaxID=63459 RepID=A0A803LIC5_CHEQI